MSSLRSNSLIDQLSTTSACRQAFQQIIDGKLSCVYDKFLVQYDLKNLIFIEHSFFNKHPIRLQNGSAYPVIIGIGIAGNLQRVVDIRNKKVFSIDFQVYEFGYCEFDYENIIAFDIDRRKMIILNINRESEQFLNATPFSAFNDGRFMARPQLFNYNDYILIVDCRMGNMFLYDRAEKKLSFYKILQECGKLRTCSVTGSYKNFLFIHDADANKHIVLDLSTMKEKICRYQSAFQYPLIINDNLYGNNFITPFETILEEQNIVFRDETVQQVLEFVPSPDFVEQCALEFALGEYFDTKLDTLQEEDVQAKVEKLKQLIESAKEVADALEEGESAHDVAVKLAAQGGAAVEIVEAEAKLPIESAKEEKETGKAAGKEGKAAAKADEVRAYAEETGKNAAKADETVSEGAAAIAEALEPQKVNAGEARAAEPREKPIEDGEKANGPQKAEPQPAAERESGKAAKSTQIDSEKAAVQANEKVEPKAAGKAKIPAPRRRESPKPRGFFACCTLPDVEEDE